MSTAPLPRLSAHALEELKHCERKFALKYLQQAFWPGTAPDDRDTRAALQLGQAFHALVQIRALDLDVTGALAALAEPGDRLAELWQAFLASPHADPPAGARVWTEQQLNFFVEDVPFNVRYDRLVLHEGRWTILDWKTGRVDPATMPGNWQTRLYRYALVAAGEALGVGPIAPEAVTLEYWEVASGRPLPLAYDAAAHAADHAALVERARYVRRPFNPRLDEDEHYKRNRDHCRQCTYHSLCNRDAAGPAAAAGPTKAPRFRRAALTPEGARGQAGEPPHPPQGRRP